MDLAARIGQTLFVGIDGTEDSPSLQTYLRTIRPGGVVIFGRNITSADQLQALTRTVARSVDPAPFLAIDQEGGRVSRLRTLVPDLPAAATLATWSEARLVAYARDLGDALAALGFSMNFAPVVDLSAPGAANLIGDRSFGLDEQNVAACAKAFIQGHLQAGIVSVLKHFPGLGATEVDSHVALPVLARDQEALWSRDLHPFRECAPEAVGVMVAHVHCPGFDPESQKPASLSRAVVEGLLRGSLGYGGLVVTDDMDMGALGTAAPGDLASDALAAGNDMVLFCNHTDKALAAFEALLADAEEGRLPAGRLEAAVSRIAHAKGRAATARAGRSRPVPGWEGAREALARAVLTAERGR